MLKWLFGCQHKWAKVSEESIIYRNRVTPSRVHIVGKLIEQECRECGTIRFKKVML